MQRVELPIAQQNEGVRRDELRPCVGLVSDHCFLVVAVDLRALPRHVSLCWHAHVDVEARPGVAHCNARVLIPESDAGGGPGS